jgi:hypothetical protein
MSILQVERKQIFKKGDKVLVSINQRGKETISYQALVVCSQDEEMGNGSFNIYRVLELDGKEVVGEVKWVNDKFCRLLSPQSQDQIKVINDHYGESETEETEM